MQEHVAPEFKIVVPAPHHHRRRSPFPLTAIKEILGKTFTTQEYNHWARKYSLEKLWILIAHYTSTTCAYSNRYIHYHDENDPIEIFSLHSIHLMYAKLSYWSGIQIIIAALYVLGNDSLVLNHARLMHSTKKKEKMCLIIGTISIVVISKCGSRPAWWAGLRYPQWEEEVNAVWVGL